MWFVVLGIVLIVVAACVFYVAGDINSPFGVVSGAISMGFGVILLANASTGMVGDISGPGGLYKDSIYRLVAQVSVPNVKNGRLLVVQDRKDSNAVYCVYNKEGVTLPNGTAFVEKVGDEAKPVILPIAPN